MSDNRHVMNLRSAYNASVMHFELVNPELCILRIKHDQMLPRIVAGQYLTLGLGGWEPRCDGIVLKAGTLDDEHNKLIKRPYSLSCPMIDEGQLVTVNQLSYLEFYITLVKKPDDIHPPLTPRLFALRPEGRLFCSAKSFGTYDLRPIDSAQHILFLSTGTGEAPHNAMLAELLSTGHRGHIVNCVCVRKKTDLGYLEVHRELERRYPQYRYLFLTTREPENVDSSRADFIGKQYLQEFFSSGQIDRAVDFSIDPATTHVFVAGNPGMIGLPRRSKDGERIYPERIGMIEILERRGFRLDTTEAVGNIHYEKYW